MYHIVRGDSALFRSGASEVTRPIQFYLCESRSDSPVSAHDRSVSREPILLGPNVGHLVSQSSLHCTLILPCTSFRRHEGECRRVAVVEQVERLSVRQPPRSACLHARHLLLISSAPLGLRLKPQASHRYQNVAIPPLVPQLLVNFHGSGANF